ncbi:MAG: hypothetical protein HY000_16565 [Planctomycetes bacterium]|nr:hypothetical protein [Planctomycetota bacterium]
MSEQLVNAIAAIAERLVALASDDAQFRAQLRQLAQAVLAVTDMPQEEASPQLPAEVQSVTVEVRQENLSDVVNGERIAAPQRAAPLRTELTGLSPSTLPELTLGESAPPVERVARSFPARWFAVTDADLPLIEARCRLKAEGARWAATRRRLISEGATFSTEIEPIHRDIIARAKAIPECFLWMCHPTGPSPADLKLYEDVAGCFEAAADILSILKHMQDEPDLERSQFEQSLDLLAEAQSALRVAIGSIDDRTDTDQVQVFNWLKATANENQIFIQRYMRADDPADPTQWAQLSSRIEELDARVQETRRRVKQRRKLLGKVRHKLSLIANEPDGAHEHGRILALTVDELVSDGLPPSNRELRELLVPAIDSLPELVQVPHGFQLVLREIDRFLATCPPTETASITQPTPEVREAARLLNGRSMLLIGGDCRPGSHQALKEAFALQELLWIETREHQSIDGFEPYIARPDVAVVLLAIRWSSHAFGEVGEFCDRHGKPLVRLPGGYSPNQVAAQIMAQCSQRLTQSK